MTKGRSGGRLHARRQIGEAAAAGDDVVELGEFFVAPVVAAFGDELARGVEFLARLLLEARRRGGVGQTGGGGLGSTRPLSGAKASRRASASRARSSAMSQR